MTHKALKKHSHPTANVSRPLIRTRLAFTQSTQKALTPNRQCVTASNTNVTGVYTKDSKSTHTQPPMCHGL